jgi:uncharacterized protein YbcC (UPF0753/DUF2309 family)
MSVQTVSESDLDIDPAPRDTRDEDDALVEKIERACSRIAPLWPLKNFVAVNPFMGFCDEPFALTCARLRRVARTDMLMPRSFYREALVEGRITDNDLAEALSTAPSSWKVPESVEALREIVNTPDEKAVSRAPVATLAEILDELAAGDRQASRTAFMVDEISKWCAAYFDAGQASWRLPNRNGNLYNAWRASVRYDRNPEMMGIRDFRKNIASLPEDPIDAIALVIEKLGVPERAVEDYLFRALFDIRGWAAYARYLAWDKALYGEDDDTLLHLLAVRVVWGYAIYLERTDEPFRQAWATAMEEASEVPHDDRLGEDPGLTVDLIMQDAYEIAFQRELRMEFSLKSAARGSAPELGRKSLQAAFCIDVRSETYRRALEIAVPGVDTIGFAGFFGFPIEYVQIGQSKGSAHCPVLLKPAFIVCEAVSGATEEEETEILGMRLVRRRAAKAWKAFKLSAVSSFTYVETAGLLFVAKILGDSARLTRPVPHPNLDGLDKSVVGRLRPRLEPREVGGRQTGFDTEQRVAMAEAVLRAMSLTEDFARLVLLVGHGSTTVNNPHATSLDCGACGGHTGEANARVAAAILNDQAVRDSLRFRGIFIPEDTWFLGALHNTTTDDVTVFDDDKAPLPHKEEIDQLKIRLAMASSIARRERANLLGLRNADDLDAAIRALSRDWSQVRPEWGLAGNAAFIAAPRNRTQGIDFGGRAFLHSYEWQKDHDYKVLELIMTAPMVVASWINLQYYGSTVNNEAFGSGNKVLHNVVGTLGVLEGNAGDLKTGLPWQSVHDGKDFVHEPRRLNVFIEAPIEAMNEVIAKHEDVRHLTDNRWLHLFALGTDGRVSHRYCGNLTWDSLQ